MCSNGMRQRQQFDKKHERLMFCSITEIRTAGLIFETLVITLRLPLVLSLQS
jgi:hypothetical protein